MKRTFKRVFKTSIESANICFSIMLLLVAISLLLGFNVIFTGYLKVGFFASLVLTVILSVLKVDINHLKNIRNKVFKTLVQSALICFSMMLILIIANALLGVYVRFSYYFKMAALGTIGLTIPLCVLRYDVIFAKNVKSSKKAVPTNTNKKTQRTVHRKRKRIS